MTFGEFCKVFDKPINGLKGIKSKANIVRFFLDTATGTPTTFEASYYGKWFNDTLSYNYWSELCDAYDSEKFVNALRNKISPSSKFALAEKFGIELEPGEEPDLLILAKAIAEQFLLIAQNSGSYEDLVINEKYQEFKTPAEWGGYVSRARENEKKCKSLLYRTQGKELEEFYVWNRISVVQPSNMGFNIAENEDTNILSEPGVSELFSDSKRVLLIGTEGIGKSMMLRKMFLNALDEYRSSGIVPFFICLREYNSSGRNILNLLAEAINTYDETFDEMEAHKLLFQGKAVVYMDGLDEISPEQFGDFHRELERITKAYSKSYFLITTRNYSLLSAADFKYMWVLPFTDLQSKELVGKLEISEDVKTAIIRLIDDDGAAYREYTSIPMLLTLLAMNYDKFDKIPSMRHELYEVAYETMLEKHDREEKDNYEKRFISVRGADEFTPVFSEFCARTCRAGEVAFTQRQFEAWLKNIEAKKELANPQLFTNKGFMDDICFKACLMYEKERGYTFLHRSFQEYLFAVYYAYADDERLIKLGAYLSNPQKCKFHNEDAFMMLYDMKPERVRRLVFLPFLKQIYEQYDDRIKFWSYLKLGYNKIKVRAFSEDVVQTYKGTMNVNENARINAPSNFLFLMLSKLCGINANFSSWFYAEDGDLEKIKEDVIVGAVLDATIEMKNVPERLLSNQHNLYDANCISDSKAPVIFGYDCVYDPALAIREPGKYATVQALLYNKGEELWEAFDVIRDFYDEVKLEDSEDNDEDF